MQLPRRFVVQCIKGTQADGKEGRLVIDGLKNLGLAFAGAKKDKAKQCEAEAKAAKTGGAKTGM
jgi:hypothetical protein